MTAFKITDSTLSTLAWFMYGIAPYTPMHDIAMAVVYEKFTIHKPNEDEVERK